MLIEYGGSRPSDPPKPIVCEPTDWWGYHAFRPLVPKEAFPKEANKFYLTFEPHTIWRPTPTWAYNAFVRWEARERRRRSRRYKARAKEDARLAKRQVKANKACGA